MANLAEELHKTIKNLEALRDSQDPVDDDLLDQLDALYDKQNELIGIAIQKSTVEYQESLDAMKEAAEKTGEAIDDLAQLENAINKVANAIAKAGDLLGSAA